MQGIVDPPQLHVPVTIVAHAAMPMQPLAQHLRSIPGVSTWMYCGKVHKEVNQHPNQESAASSTRMIAVNVRSLDREIFVFVSLLRDCVLSKGIPPIYEHVAVNESHPRTLRN